MQERPVLRGQARRVFTRYALSGLGPIVYVRVSANGVAVYEWGLNLSYVSRNFMQAFYLSHVLHSIYN